MGSFLGKIESVLGKIGHGINIGLGIEQQAAPLVNLIPGGTIVNTVVTGILALEHLFPQSGLGASKAALVTAAAGAAVPGIDPAEVQAAISQIVAAFNALQAAAGKVPAVTAPPSP